MPLGKDLYNVSFRGNGYTSSPEVQTLLLRRCADLTLNNGYKYFIILQTNANDEASIYHTMATSNTSIASSSIQNGPSSLANVNSNTFVAPHLDESVHRYTADVVIKMLQSNQEASFAYDAAVIKHNFNT